jgi:hypothetical protein
MVPLMDDVEPALVVGRDADWELRLILGAELCRIETLDKLGRLYLRLPKA